MSRFRNPKESQWRYFKPCWSRVRYKNRDNHSLHYEGVLQNKQIINMYKVKRSKGNIKVHIFWERHKILQNLHSRFDHYYQKYSRLRCLLRVKGLAICIYLGWSGSILQFRQNIIKVGSKSLLLTCSSNQLWAYLYYIFLIRRES